MSTNVEGHPAQPDSEQSRRLPVVVMTLAGLSLVVMGQSVYQENYGAWRWLLYLLMLAGILLFSLAGVFIARRRLPQSITSTAERLTRFFSITTAQLALVLTAPLFGLMAYLAAGDGLRAHNISVSLAAWILSITAIFVGTRKTGSKIKIFDRRDWIIVAFLFLLALLLRAINLNELPQTLSGDEGSAGLFSLKFLSGEVNNIFGPGWFSFPALYFALQSLGIYLFGQTAEALRISSAVAGALTVVALYWLARVTFNRRTAVIAALLLATFHFHIHFSRIGLNNIWDGLFAVIVLGGLAYGWRSGRRSGFQMAGLALGLGQYFYVSIRIFPLLILLWAILIFVFDRAAFKRRLSDLAAFGLIAFVVSMPVNLYYLSHPAEYYAPLQRVTILDGWLENEMVNRGQSAAQIMAQQLTDSALGITNLPLRHWYNPGAPLLLAGAAGLFLLGLFWLLTRIKLLTVLILLPLLAVVILGAFTVNPPASQRYIMAAPIAVLLVAVPLSVSYGMLSRAWPRARPLFLVGVFLAVSAMALNDIRYYFLEVYDGYILGGHNTEVATEVARYLSEEKPDSDVYFFGLPRMGYYSHSTIPYLAPDVSAVDISDPLTAEPSYLLDQDTVFIFLPERIQELTHTKSAFPLGEVREFAREDGQPLFTSYEFSPP